MLVTYVQGNLLQNQQEIQKDNPDDDDACGTLWCKDGRSVPEKSMTTRATWSFTKQNEKFLALVKAFANVCLLVPLNF